MYRREKSKWIRHRLKIQIESWDTEGFSLLVRALLSKATHSQFRHRSFMSRSGLEGEGTWLMGASRSCGGHRGQNKAPFTWEWLKQPSHYTTTTQGLWCYRTWEEPAASTHDTLPMPSLERRSRGTTHTHLATYISIVIPQSPKNNFKRSHTNHALWHQYLIHSFNSFTKRPIRKRYSPGHKTLDHLTWYPGLGGQ